MKINSLNCAIETRNVTKDPGTPMLPSNRNLNSVSYHFSFISDAPAAYMFLWFLYKPLFFIQVVSLCFPDSCISSPHLSPFSPTYNPISSLLGSVTLILSQRLCHNLYLQKNLFYPLILWSHELSNKIIY